MKPDTISSVLQFRDERNWGQFHNPKDLAISLSLEASELLETFQWKSSEEAVACNLSAMKEELADVLIYATLLSDRLGFDMDEIVRAKLALNAEKYPVSKSFGSSKKYTGFE